MGAFYGLYTIVRDVNGDRPTSVARAYGNARHIIGLERHVGLWHEAAIQHAFIHDRDLLEFWDGYYGTVHFLAVIGVLVVLFARWPAHYRRWRNTLALTTLVALVGFALFPLMPPRLLPARYGFVDTLSTIGGVWDFKQGAVDSVSNQYAAMPSLHTAWALWCALALWPLVRRANLRPLLLAYPAATVFCILVTANHYLADEVGGVAALGLGYAGALGLEALGRRVRLRVRVPTSA